MRRFLTILILAFVHSIAFAAPTATLTWVAPTTNTDGTQITVPLTYNVYDCVGTTPSCTVGTTAVQTGVSALTVVITAGMVDGTTACFAVTAVEGVQEGAKSNTACKTFPAATPTAPGTLTVQ